MILTNQGASVKIYGKQTLRCKTKSGNSLHIYFVSAHSLPMFREKRYKSKKKVIEADRKDPLKSHRPDLPVTGPGK